MNESIWQRIELVQAAWQMFRQSPIFGIGLGSFLPRLPEFLLPRQFYFLQPVHNIFLLILTETGVIVFGLTIFGLGLILKRLWKKRKHPLFLALLVIILTGFFDHYWLTLQQTQLLFALILGLSLKFD